jgi:hypothetical protein
MPADALTIRAHRRAVRALLVARVEHSSQGEPATAESAAPLPLVPTTHTHLASGTSADAA